MIIQPLEHYFGKIYIETFSSFVEKVIQYSEIISKLYEKYIANIEDLF